MLFRSISIYEDGTVDATSKYFQINDHEGLVEDIDILSEKDVDTALLLLNNYLEKFKYHQIFTKQDFIKLFLNNKFITCLVIKNNDGSIVDIASYYKLQTKSLKTNKIINKACLFYYTSNTITKYSVGRLLLSIAKTEGLDVFCATNVMNNMDLIENNRFVLSNGKSYFYLYNWNYNEVKSNELSAYVL